MLKKTCTLADFKMLDEGSGSFQGYGSTWDNVDLAGEVVVKGAFTKTLDAFKQAGFIALGHDWGGLPVATVENAYEDEKGLFIKGDFHSTEQAQAARTYVRERLERGKSVGLSIGYTVKDSERTKAGLLLKEIELWECSLVSVPCNPLAQATGVKAADTAPALSLSDLRAHLDDLFSAKLFPVLFDGEASSEERILRLDATLADLPGVIAKSLGQAMLAADDDTDPATDYKAVFSGPALAAGRFAESLDLALAATKAVTDRYARYCATKEADGRIPSPDRRTQLLAIHEAMGDLLAKTTPPEPIDLDHLREISIARRRRIARAIGAIAP